MAHPARSNELSKMYSYVLRGFEASHSLITCELPSPTSIWERSENQEFLTFFLTWWNIQKPSERGTHIRSGGSNDFFGLWAAVTQQMKTFWEMNTWAWASCIGKCSQEMDFYCRLVLKRIPALLLLLGSGGSNRWEVEWWAIVPPKTGSFGHSAPSARRELWKLQKI